MAPKQIGAFELGCWLALAAAGLQAVAHVWGQPDLPPHAIAGLSLMPPAYVFPVPGLRQPTYQGVVAGLSMAVIVLMATTGAVGLVVLRHGQAHAQLVRGVARVLAIGSAALLVTSVVLAFSVQTFAIALVAICFGLAAVPPE